MEIFATVLRYIFVAVLTVEVILIGRALFTLALSKARPVADAPAAEE